MVVVAAGVAVGAAVATTGTTGPDKAAATHLLRASLAAAEKAGSFHYVASSVSSTPFNPSSSPVSQVTVGDAGVLGGRQMITIAKHTFDVIVTGTTAFFEGDADAMVDELGVPTSVAHSYAGRWISLVPGDTPYQSVEVAVTTSSALQQNVTFTANEEIPTAKIDGEPVIGLRGPMGKQQGQVAKGTATLYVAARGKHLPVRYVEQGTVGTGQQASKFEFSLAFSAWGEAVSTTAPAGAVAFSSLEASGPSGPTIIT
ncbi:MAG TPA: hypothetical protein VK386_06115 [Acidimicrobiales bacterium]|nr:hypothetical protein [Acidimicrobiales bacterium]